MIIIDPSIDPKDLYRLIRSGDVSMEDFEFYIQDIHDIAHADGAADVFLVHDEEGLRAEYKKLVRSQKPLDPEFAKILNDNLEDLIHNEY